MQSSVFINWPLGRSGHSLALSYQKALSREIERGAPCLQEPIESLYMAAPCADALGIECLLDTSGTLLKTVTFFAGAECSLEIGQGAISLQQAASWKHAGINRIVIHYNKDSLVHIEQLRKNINTIARYIKNISVDIYTASASTVRAVIALPITHISLYTIAGFSQAKKEIEEAGFISYEWQHFALPGFQSRHALTYWNRKPYKGFGAGACSFDGTIRTKNSGDIKRYIACAQDDQSLYEYEEKLSDQEIYFEKIMIGLRRPQGVCKKIISPETEKKMNDCIESGLLVDCGATIRYTDRGFLIENQVLTQII